MSPMSPTELHLDLPAAPEEAFAAFTERMGDWWDPAFTPDAATFSGIDLDAQVGGEVAMVHGDDRVVWGRVTQWQPAGRYAQLFWLSHQRAHPSEVSAEFERVGDHTRLTLRHGGWTEETVRERDKFGDWERLLERYSALLAG